MKKNKKEDDEEIRRAKANIRTGSRDLLLQL